MLTRTPVKRLIYQANRTFSWSNLKEETGKPVVPKKETDVPSFSRAEFEPFKFRHERENLHYGYTIQELYGKRYGVKHSPAIRREITKDNFMIVIAFGIVLGLCLSGRHHQEREDEAFDEYYYSDMNYYHNKDATK